MRILFALPMVAALLLFPALCPMRAQIAAQNAPSASASPHGQGGVTAAPDTRTYEDPALHLVYRYPAEFTDASGTVGPAMEAALNDAPGTAPGMTHCVSLPFSAMTTKGDGLRVVLLVRVDASCLKKTLKPSDMAELTQGEVHGLTASGGHPQFSEPIAYATSNHAAAMIRGSFTLPTGQPLHTLAACVLLKPDAVCWQFLASSDAALNTMTAFPASLDGQPQAPVVPANLLPKP